MFDILEALPPALPVGVLVITHRNARYETDIEESIRTQCPVIVKRAQEKDTICAGTVYFAPAGYHLLVEPDRSLSLDISEPVHFCRPSIDVALQSVTDVYGPATAAVLLSGANQDGAMGMRAVKRAGGLCIVQSPVDAEIKTMPEAVIALGAADLILTNEELVELSQGLDHYILTGKPSWRN